MSSSQNTRKCLAPSRKPRAGLRQSSLQNRGGLNYSTLKLPVVKLPLIYTTNGLKKRPLLLMFQEAEKCNVPLLLTLKTVENVTYHYF